jgi:hypothetical protein
MKTKSGPLIGGSLHGMAIALALIACAAPLTPASAAPPNAAASHGAATDAYSAELTGCADRGGRVSRGPFGETYCRIPYPDGGKACADTSDCVGACIWQPRSGPLRAPEARVVGTCQRTNVQYGCFGRVEHGRVKHMLCVD